MMPSECQQTRSQRIQGILVVGCRTDGIFIWGQRRITLPPADGQPKQESELK